MSDTEKTSSFRQSMSGLHTWVGLVPAWILYFMFITGTAGYFRVEITRWMQPEIPFSGEKASQADMLTMAEQRLKLMGSNADEWYIGFPDQRESFLRIEWEKELSEVEIQTLSEEEQEQREDELEGRELLYPQTGLPVVYANAESEPRDTGGGNDLYLMHYVLHYMSSSTARYLVILCTLFMLTGLITGIVIHKKIFKEFFTFRPRKKQRSWLDMHNIFSVLTLPFQLMITYSGLLFFTATLLPLVQIQPAAMVGELGFDIPNIVATVQAVTNADGNQEEVLSETMSEENQAIIRAVATALEVDVDVVLGSDEEIIITPAPLLPLSTFVQSANNHSPNKAIAYLSIDNPYYSHGRVSVVFRSGPSRNGGELVFSAANGEFVDEPGNLELASTKVKQTILGLHEGRFSPIVLRWLYFVTGLLGAGMIATGSILWSVKRRTQFEKAVQKGRAPTKKGLVLVERFNIATIVGLPIAVAAYFWANRLIPLGIEERHEWEMHTLFIVWGLTFIFSILRPLQRAWLEMLYIAVAAFGLIPVVNFFTTDRHLGISLPQGDWLMAGFDLTMLVFSLGFAVAVRQVLKKQRSLLSAKANNDVREKSSDAALVEGIPSS